MYAHQQNRSYHYLHCWMHQCSYNIVVSLAESVDFIAILGKANYACPECPGICSHECRHNFDNQKLYGRCMGKGRTVCKCFKHNYAF